jgi:D-alanyl-D-alanine carboxypeptidase
MKLLTTAQMIERYGAPNQSGTYLVSVPLPFPMRLAWDTSATVKTMRCHNYEAPRVRLIFEQILQKYGIAKVQALGIDLFGGCFNFRQMRGGSDWSKHSWGTAIDLDPERNKLNETKATARFARPEYAPMIDIFERNGWASLGRLKDYDWMHFEAAA